MNIKVEMAREEICELLGVGNEGLKTIIRNNNLEERINCSGYGYTYIGKRKEGRNVIYELECDKEDDLWLQFQNYYKIRDYDKHTQYTETRIDNLDKPRSKVVEMSKTKIADKTAKRYDDILISENMIEENNMIYVKYNLNTKEFIEISEEDYKIFWKDNAVTKNAISDVYRRKYKGEYSEDFSSHAIVELTTTSSVNGYVAYKFMSYKELEDAKKLREWIANRKIK